MRTGPGGPRSTPRPSPRPSPPAPLHFGPFICCVLLFGGSPRRAGKAAQCRQEEEEGWGEARPELCQMWERREGGTLAARSLPPLPAPRRGRRGPHPGGGHAGVTGPGASPGARRARQALGEHPHARGGRRAGSPPALPALASLHPPHCSRPGGREEEQGQGPACGRRPCRAVPCRAVPRRAAGEGRQAGRQAGRQRCERAGAACHVARAARPGCLCVPVPPGRPGQGVPREEETSQLCRGEVAGSPPLFFFSFSLSQLHLGAAAR